MLGCVAGCICGLKGNHTDTQAPCSNFWFASRPFSFAAGSHAEGGQHLCKHGAWQHGREEYQSCVSYGCVSEGLARMKRNFGTLPLRASIDVGHPLHAILQQTKMVARQTKS